MDLVNAKLLEAPCQPRSEKEGPTGTRPLLGLSPIKALNEAGIRMDPPPSEAAAIETIPEATAAAAPPLDPPAFRVLSSGNLTGP